MRHLVSSWSAKPFATIDPEEFFDFTVARPMISVTEEGQRDLTWPSNQFFYHRNDDGDSDILLFLGTEPHLKWRAFTSTIRDFFRRLGGERLLTLGSLVAATTHTRPPPLTGFATEDDLRSRIEGLTINRARYEGPTGIVGPLHDAWRRAELPAASLWVGLPPYLGEATNPRGALALLQQLDKLFAFAPDLSALSEKSRKFEEQVDAALDSNPELKKYLGELERRVDSGISEAGAPDAARSGDLMGDLESFLRQQRGG